MKKQKCKVTVFTPTYNRAKTLPKVYDSLKKQTLTDFEWIIVDDGSTDCTGELVSKWVDQKKIDIRYYYQENNGKHIAMNFAVSQANGEYFVTLDSDDAITENALSLMLEQWERIPLNKRKQIASVKARCYDPKTNKGVGPDIPYNHRVCSMLDAKYKYKFASEMISMTSLEVLKEFPNPDIRGGEKSGLRFYPEGIWQDLAARKYKTVFMNETLCAYTQDNSESLLGRGKKYNRFKENIYLWTHMVNDDYDYFIYDPKSFLKATVGVSMDGFFLKKSIKEILGLVKGLHKKTMILICMPIGYFCYKRRR